MKGGTYTVTLEGGAERNVHLSGPWPGPRGTKYAAHCNHTGAAETGFTIQGAYKALTDNWGVTAVRDSKLSAYDVRMGRTR